MAIVVEATATHNWATGSTTFTVTKPTGTVDGDFLVVVIGTASDGSTLVVSGVPSGWTLKQETVNTPTAATARVYIYYKIASSEGASWDWTLNTSGATHFYAGCALRISGTNQINSSDDGTDVNDETPEFVGGVTPLGANGLLIMAMSAIDATSSTTVSGYAITTSNPSWTEVIDTYEAAVPDASFAVAYAIRPEATATGNWTLTFSAGTTMDTCSILSFLPAVVNINHSASVLSAIFSVIAPAVAAAANVTAGVLSAVFNLIAPTVSTPTSDWQNQDKSSTSTFNNQDKS